MQTMEPVTGWIIYPRYTADRSDNAFGWLVGEAAAAGMRLEVLFVEELSVVYGTRCGIFHKGREVVQMPEFVIMRTYDTVLSRYFERLGVRVINTAAAMELCKNKMLTHEVLVAAGLPTPTTVYAEGAEYAYPELAERFGSARFIVKRTDGAKGEDVYLVNGAREMASAVEQCGRHCICQEFIAESSGRDVRVWVIGGRAVGAGMRYSQTSFLSNYSQGGSVRAFDLPEEAARLAVESAAATGAEFAGIDLLFRGDGFTVNEVNGNAGFRTLSRVGRNDIPKELFSYISGIVRQG